jgi:hypothetical protein
MDNNADDLLNMIGQMKRQQKTSASEDDLAVNEANKVIRAILDFCCGHEMKVTASVGFYPLGPIDSGHNEQPVPILATYRITLTEIQNEDGLPVNGSGDLSRKFMNDCRNGLVHGISKELDRQRSSGMPRTMGT